MLTRLCPRLSDISVFSGVCVDIKYLQFFVFSSLCNHSHYFQRKGPEKEYVILKPTDAEGSFSVRVSRCFCLTKPYSSCS